MGRRLLSRARRNRQRSSRSASRTSASTARDKVGILSNTRPEWTYRDFAILCAGATVVPIYQTNSPEECHYVLEHSESEGGDHRGPEQLEKIRKVRDQLPNLEHVISIEPIEADDVISMDELREQGRGRTDEDFKAAHRVGVEPSDVATYIYTSGTTGPPKGCVIDHANWRDMLDMVQRQNVLMEDEVAYLFLPLAHAFARLIQLGSLDVGATHRLLGEGPAEDHPQPDRGQADVLPERPAHVREDLRDWRSRAPSTRRSSSKRRSSTGRRRCARCASWSARARAGPAPSGSTRSTGRRECCSNVRNLFGGRIKQCVTGAAPISQEILEFFWACGVLVLEGYGMTETSTARHDQQP